MVMVEAAEVGLTVSQEEVGDIHSHTVIIQDVGNSVADITIGGETDGFSIHGISHSATVDIQVTDTADSLATDFIN